MKYHDTKIIVIFYNGTQECKVNGNIYCLTNDRHDLYSLKKVLNYGIQSYNYPNLVIKNVINTYNLDECTNPSSMLYFWGFDKSKVKNIKLQLDSYSYYYDGSIDSLEYRKQSLGYTCDPVVMFFTTEKLTEYPQGTLNLYGMEKAQLIIETDQEETSNFYLVNIGARGLVYDKGMINYTVNSL